ncbi:hypothetical protein BD310DRAFT_939717 [Dichomitus squalens]|uniref:Uncharacterized protein n=1 Tax=Dichomitus squalens TaxID=114155 RepID=A0A4Q9PHX1_9APHY|nr:hypothetical protein BD310DRAFT_939717 [Dichomitus squalens]
MSTVRRLGSVHLALPLYSRSSTPSSAICRDNNVSMNSTLLCRTISEVVARFKPSENLPFFLRFVAFANECRLLLSFLELSR